MSSYELYMGVLLLSEFRLSCIANSAVHFVCSSNLSYKLLKLIQLWKVRAFPVVSRYYILVLLQNIICQIEIESRLIVYRSISVVSLSYYNKFLV